MEEVAALRLKALTHIRNAFGLLEKILLADGEHWILNPPNSHWQILKVQHSPL
jgi:hypothetical protein